MLNKAIEYVMRKVAKRYVRRRVPSGRALLVGAVGVGVVAIAAIAAAKREDLFG